jgi:rubredoxin
MSLKKAKLRRSRKAQEGFKDSLQKRRKKMAVWRCTICNYEYDEAVEGTSFEKLPDDWKCPVCDAPKDAFEKIS